MNPWLCRNALLLLLALLPFGRKKQQPQQAYLLKPNQTAGVDASMTIAARQNCENWALAAGLEAMLREQHVALTQSFWVMRMNGGELCVSELPSPDTLARLVDREFVLDDGRHVRLRLNFTAGAPTNIDTLIARLRQRQLSLILWRGHPYYLVGATYDEFVGRDGSRLFEVKELRLANTFAAIPGVTFEKGRDDPGDIGGIFTVSVTVI